MLVHDTINAQDVEVELVTRIYNNINAAYPLNTLNSRVLGVRLDDAQGIFVSLSATSTLLRVQASDDGVLIATGSIQIPPDATSGGRWSTQWIRLRLRLVGSSLRMKAWLDATPEPEKWTLVATVNTVRAGQIALGNSAENIAEFGWVAVSEAGGLLRPGDNMLWDDSDADFSSYKNLILSTAWSLHPNVGTTPTVSNPESSVWFFNDVDATLPGYRAARARAIEVALAAGNPIPPAHDGPGGYSHCSRYAGTVTIPMVDPMFPGDYTGSQNDYLSDPRNGWSLIGDGFDVNDSRLGDVWVTRNPGHVFIFVGDHGGFDDVVVDASYNGAATTTKSNTARLRRWYLNPSTGMDGGNRPYWGWRFTGRADHAPRLLV